MIGEYKKEMLPEIKKLEAWQKSSKMYEADIVYITKSDYLSVNIFTESFGKERRTVLCSFSTKLYGANKDRLSQHFF